MTVTGPWTVLKAYIVVMFNSYHRQFQSATACKRMVRLRIGSEPTILLLSDFRLERFVEVFKREGNHVVVAIARLQRWWGLFIRHHLARNNTLSHWYTTSQEVQSRIEHGFCVGLRHAQSSIQNKNVCWHACSSVSIAFWHLNPVSTAWLSLCW